MIDIKRLLPQKCLSPVRTVSPDGAVHYVSCRHCLNCLTSSAKSWAKRLDDEARDSVCALFGTLTYRNFHLPVYRFRHIDGDYAIYSPFRISDGYSVQDTSVRLPDMALHISEAFDAPQPVGYPYSNCFGVVYKRDFQLFIGRLRKQVQKYVKRYNKTAIVPISEYQSRFRYYIASEYGPSTFRPHAHYELFFRDSRVCQFVLSKIHSCWSFGAPDDCPVEYVRGSANQYIGEYITGAIGLPACLKKQFSRIFRLHSNSPSIGYSRFTYEYLDKVLQDDLSRINTDSELGYRQTALEYPQRNADSLECRSVSVPIDVIHRLFPKCRDFSNKSSSAKLHLYSFLYNIEERTGMSYKEYFKKNHFRLYDYRVSNPDFAKYPYIDLFVKISASKLSVPALFSVSDVYAMVSCLKWCRQFNRTPVEYLAKLDYVHTQYEIHKLRNFYLYQENVQDEPSTFCYPETMSLLPPSLDSLTDEKVFDLWYLFDSLDMELSDFYTKILPDSNCNRTRYVLNSDFYRLTSFHFSSVFQSYCSDVLEHHQRSLCKKTHNDKNLKIFNHG